MSIISANEQAAETAWKALVNEDRLLARIEALEAQLSVLSNNNNPDKQKEELLIMIDEKTKFEAMTKEMIRRLIEENEETSSRLKDMERSLETSDLNCQQLNAKNHDLETALAETTALSDEKEAEVVQLTAENNEKQKTLLACKERLGEVTEMNMKLSMNAINNESASGLARLLANAVNNGKFIGAPELSLLVNTLKAASYFPPHSRSTSSSADQSLSSDSEVRTQLTNGVVVEQIEDKSVESYLKTILELQAKNRDLEMKMIAATAAENEKLEAPLELSPSENVAFFPAGTSDSFSTVSVGSQNAAVQKQQTVIRKADGMQNFLLMVSLVPLLALIFSALAPIQKRLMSATSSQKSKKETE
uniref:Uncharacterized protein n=1 Tax=Caenorhabditis japonica TaxID=281687 RepID=A0A8R1I394_CAEJA